MQYLTTYVVYVVYFFPNYIEKVCFNFVKVIFTIVLLQTVRTRQNEETTSNPIIFFSSKYLMIFHGFAQRSTGRNTFGLCSDIVTRFWCYLDIKLTILTVSHNIWQFLVIFVLNHLVILLRLSSGHYSSGLQIILM